MASPPDHRVHVLIHSIVSANKDRVKQPSRQDSDVRKQSPAPRPDRAAREAAALRANLLKRKDQARKRQGEAEKLETPQTPETQLR